MPGSGFVANVVRNMVQRHGGPVQIIKNYGQPHETRHTARALKNSKSKGSRQEVFQFVKKVPADVGDIIQQEGSRDLYLITETHDHVYGGTFAFFEVEIERATVEGAAKPRPAVGHQISIGNVTGAVQIDSPGATQNVAINQQLQQKIDDLRAAVKSVEADDLDKEEALAAVERVQQLAGREQNEKTKKTVGEKLDLIDKTLGVVEKGKAMIGPAVIAMRLYFGI